MSFGRLLRRRLGPLSELAPRARSVERPPTDTLWVRRGVGLEFEVRPFERSGRVRASGPRGSTPLELFDDEARRLVGLTRWTPAQEAGVELATLDAWIEADLLYWAREDPGVPLPSAHPIAPRGRLARRRAVWPTPAVETAVAIAPLPFMPRGADLDGAEMVGMRFATLERGHEILGLTVLGDARLGAELRALLPLLDGRAERARLIEQAPREHRRRRARLLELLELSGALESVTDGPLGPSSPAEHPQVTWLGHAAALVEDRGGAILVDPLFHAASEPPADPYPRPDPRALPPLDAILVTHGDNDHLSPNALAQLDPSTPVIVPRVREPRGPHQVDIEGVLRVLGFRDVRPLEPFEAARIGPFEIHGLPFDGEDWGLEQAQLTYLLESEGLSVFLSADSRGPEATYRWLADRPRRVDLAFMGVSGASEPLVAPPGLGYGNFYAPWMPPARRNEFVHHTAGPADSAAFCAIFAPRRAFGYAAGGVPYIRTEYPDRGDHEAFAEALRGGPTEGLRLPLGAAVRLG